MGHPHERQGINETERTETKNEELADHIRKRGGFCRMSLVCSGINKITLRKIIHDIFSLLGAGVYVAKLNPCKVKARPYGRAFSWSPP
ncbi:hypothetical protein PANT111_560080 [Pantoea brenneri]|uniref:Uncharacterized protein n=1 Tax=Pantoea brenneri TaxID=472694 RepID=A0AAX3JC92_9GAMM|nr:hypothetical protein PANT111_560080 [Pantoea brenneri]